MVAQAVANFKKLPDMFIYDSKLFKKQKNIRSKFKVNA